MYIKTNSEFEVNISGRERSNFRKLMSSKNDYLNNNNKLSLDFYFHIFDKVTQQNYDMIKDAFQRFRETNDYQKLHQLIFV